MTDTIYVVIKTTGEYSDRSEALVCWFATEAEAVAHVAKLTAEYKPGQFDYDAPTFSFCEVERGPVTP